MRRAMPSAWASVSARWSATPEVRAWRSPPPRSSAVTTSPVAAFTSGGPPRKIVPWPRTMIDLVGHGGHVGAARRAGAHDDRDLRDAGGRHAGLVEEDAAEMVAVGEHLVLVRQVGAAANRRGRGRAAGSRPRSPARAGASSRSRGSRCRPSRWRRWPTTTHSRPMTRPMPAISPAAGTSPPYMPCAASGPSSRKGEPGSSRASTRSRGSILPRSRWRTRAAGPPPSRARATVARRSSTSAAMASALARASAERGSIAVISVANRPSPMRGS